MIIKHTEDTNLILNVRLDLPTQHAIDEKGCEMDLWITSPDLAHDEGGFILKIKDILLEGVEDRDSAESIISWLDFYKNEIIKKTGFLVMESMR